MTRASEHNGTPRLRGDAKSKHELVTQALGLCSRARGAPGTWALLKPDVGSELVQSFQVGVAVDQETRERLAGSGWQLKREVRGLLVVLRIRPDDVTLVQPKPIDTGTVHNRLREQGVVMRDTHGRER